MRSFIAAALTLAGAALAAPAAGQDAKSAKFQLRVVNSDAIFGWALVNAHVAAGTNVIQIQRPAAYQSDVSHLSGGELFFGTWKVSILFLDPAVAGEEVDKKKGGKKERNERGKKMMC